MIGKMLCLVLMCLVLGISSQAPQSPWPTLTPNPQWPGKQSRINISSSSSPSDSSSSGRSSRSSSSSAYRESFNNEQAIAQLALTMEEELLVEMLPFKPPFKMTKKQMAVIIKLLKKIVKPVLKSERLRTMVAIVDDFMQDLEYNQENKKYYTVMLNAAQDVYREVNRLYNTENMDEAQARTMNSAMQTVSNIYRSSVLNNWFIQPFNNWILYPITSRITTAAERVYNLMPNNSWVVDTNYINPFTSWGETFNFYVNQISNWSARARNTLDATNRLLDQQDSTARCAGCSSGDDSDSSTEIE